MRVDWQPTENPSIVNATHQNFPKRADDNGLEALTPCQGMFDDGVR